MSARADFECRKCEATYDDLPVGSTRCPVCGSKRGFRRLFNRVNVSTRGHAAAQLVDEHVGPMYERAKAIRESAEAARAAVPASVHQLRLPGASVLQSLSGDARNGSRSVTLPVMQLLRHPRAQVVAEHKAEVK